MARFSLGNPSGAAYDANEPFMVLWNPASNIALQVYRITATVSTTASGSEIALHRVTTTGTSGATLTPDADNHFGRRAAPVSAAILHRGNFTANPTQMTPALLRAQLRDVVGSEQEWWFPEPIIVPAGTGLGLYGVTAGTNHSVTFEWEE